MAKLNMKLEMPKLLASGGKGAASGGGTTTAGKRINAKIGLDIGSRYIKLAHMSATTQGINLLNFGYAATPMGSVNEGEINNPEAVGEAIAQIVKWYKIKEKRVVCSLPGRSVNVRQVTIPAGMPAKEVKTAIISEVERFLPFPLDEMEFTYHMLGDIMQGDVRQTSVLFIASRKDAVAKRVEAARYAGLESVETDVDPFVLLRSVIESGMSEDHDTFGQTILLLDMGASATNVSIIANGSLRFTRIFAISGDTFTHAIESGLDLSYLESEKAKMESGAAVLDEENMIIDDRMREIYELISPHLEQLAMEIRRTIAYYTSKYRGESISKIVLIGGGSLLRGINRFFENDLGIQVVYGNPLANITYVSDGDVNKLGRIVPFMGVCSGLALRQINPKLLGKYTLPVRIEPAYEFGNTAQGGGGVG